MATMGTPCPLNQRFILSFILLILIQPLTLLNSFRHLPKSLQHDSPIHGISAMLISIVLFSAMDSIVKWLGGSYPTHQIMFFRCAVAMVPIVVIITMRGGISLLRIQEPFLLSIRCLLGITAMGFAFYAFSLMRLADGLAILHTTPLFMTVLSIMFLKERVGLHRWAAVMAGFIGMTIVVRPGNSMFESGSFYMLLAAFCISCTTILIRHLSIRSDPVNLTFYFTMSGVVISSIAIFFLGWQAPEGRDWAFFIAVGFLGGMAQYLMNVSYRQAQISMVAPLKYLSIGFGGMIAYFVWSELPDLQSLVGISIIIACGLYTLHRELFHNRK
jgi:drug/metabolite transporter (DMT)-like permease|tara:strand:- start:30029 stop:31015 length:987 start_codon:yes stop_codon:yes gene_type:complete